MGYTIMYNSIFIKTEKYIIPAVLTGSSNVTDPYNNNRRDRDWAVFANNFFESDKELMDFVKSFTGKKYQEHWKKNNKWVDDAGIIRWAKNGILKAAAIEEILAYNGLKSVDCKIHIWSADNCSTKTAYISTTKQLDEWVESVKEAYNIYPKEKGFEVYPVVSFAKETLMTPPQDKNPDRNVLLKKNNKYLTKIYETGSEWSMDINSALEMTYQEALELKAGDMHGIYSEATVINAVAGNYPWNAVIFVKKSNYQGYVSRVTTSRFLCSSAKANAKRYRNEEAAYSAINRMKKKYNANIAFSVVTL